MEKESIYYNFDVPQDLQFKTQDILRMGGLSCFSKISKNYLSDILVLPNKITEATIDLSFSVSSSDILVQGTVKGKRQIECARCLKQTEQDFSESFFETYSNKLEIIDIMSIVRQTLALTEEIRFLCKEDCKGICPTCGQDLNVASCQCKPEVLSPFMQLKGKFK